MMVKFKNIFSVAKSSPKQAKGYLMSCVHIWKQMSWENCVGIYTDGAPSMVGSIRGLASLIKKENPDAVTTHCFIHREVLVSKTLRDEMKNVLDDATKMVNFIKDQFTPGCLKNCVKTWTSSTQISCYIQKSDSLGEEEFSTGCLS
jgi:hypothetical protein